MKMLKLFFLFIVSTCVLQANETKLKKIIKTESGRIYAARKVYKPTKNPEKQNRDQEIIEELISNKELLNKLDKHINKIKKSESELLWFFIKQNKETIKYLEQVYPDYFKDILSKNPFALNGYKKIGSTVTLIKHPLILLTSIITPLILVPMITEKKSFSGCAKLSLRIFKNLFYPQEYTRTKMKDESFLKKILIFSPYIAIYALNIMVIMKSIKDIIKEKEIVHHINKKLNAVSAYLLSTESIEKLIQNNNVLAQHIDCSKNIAPLFEKSKKLVEYLKTKTPSTGLILTSFKLMQQEYSNFGNVIRLIGKIDNYVATAKQQVTK